MLFRNSIMSGLINTLYLTTVAQSQNLEIQNNNTCQNLLIHQIWLSQKSPHMYVYPFKIVWQDRNLCKIWKREYCRVSMDCLVSSLPYNDISMGGSLTRWPGQISRDFDQRWVQNEAKIHLSNRLFSHTHLFLITPHHQLFWPLSCSYLPVPASWRHLDI